MSTVNDFENTEVMESDEKNESSAFGDLFGTVVDMFGLIRQNIILFLLVLAVCTAAAFGYSAYCYEPLYKVTATFSITPLVSSNSSNGSSVYKFNYTSSFANQLAETFPYIVESNNLRDVIATDLGGWINGSISAVAVTSTNVFQATVLSSVPEDAVNIMNSFIKNFPKISNYIIGDTRLNMIYRSDDPTEPVNSPDHFRHSSYGFLAGLVIELIVFFFQSFKPDGIVLWLAKEQFPNEVIPETLEALKEKGLTVKFCEDLRSHKKYYYTFKEYPDDNIIIVDDDMFYPLDMIKKLVKLHKKYPKDIICTSAQIIYPNLSALPIEWVVAKNYADYSESLYVQTFSGAGSLFPPKWYPDELFDIEKIKSMAWTADDLWLKAMSIVNGVRTTKINKFRAFNVEINNPHNETLFSVNKSDGENLNNKVWNKLVDYYHLDKYEK